MGIYSEDPEGGYDSDRRSLGDSFSSDINGGRSGWTSVVETDMEDIFVDPKKKKHSSLSSSGGVTIAWQDLSVYVPRDKKETFFGKKAQAPLRPFKRVINNVSGIVYPGSLMAIMGSSGAGKTTLMNVLANKGKAMIDGEIRVNGMPVGRFMNHMSGYVYQHDLFLGSLTVSEHLHFMAKMKMDRRISKKERELRVEELLTELGLQKCADTKIGIPGLISGISGGERKRLSFASEVITDPPLLFCDEPTSGLDSYSAQKLVAIMQSLAARGKTILCTIHQPSSQVFSMFDQLLLLAEGRTAYMGCAKGGLSFMAGLGLVCPEQYNPADFYIRTLAVHPGKEEESKDQIRKICDEFSTSPGGKEIDKKVRKEMKSDVEYLKQAMESSSDGLSDQTILGFHTRRPNWLTQTYWLTWRNFLHSVRNPRIHAIRTVQKVIIALLIGVCYLGVQLNQMGIQDIQGVLFVFISENTFRNMYGIINVFPSELPVFKRENQGGLYRCDSYYISKVASMLPGFILEPLLFTTIAYWMVGLRASADSFFYTCLVILLTANVAAAAGCFFSAAFETTMIAITCLIPFDLFLMITAGIYINIGTLPAYVSWSKFISWFSYAYEALTISQWSNVTGIVCEGPPGTPCIQDGAGVIESKAFSESHFTMDIIGLASLYGVFHVLGYLALLRRSKKD